MMRPRDLLIPLADAHGVGVEVRELLREALTPKKDWGCIMGLAETWPDGLQIKIFDHTLKNWPFFMDAVKLELEVARLLREKGHAVTAQEAIENHELRTAWLLRDIEIIRFWRPSKRHRVNGKIVRRPAQWFVWRRPFMKLLRRFQHIAAEMYGQEHW